MILTETKKDMSQPNQPNQPTFRSFDSAQQRLAAARPDSESSRANSSRCSERPSLTGSRSQGVGSSGGWKGAGMVDIHKIYNYNMYIYIYKFTCLQ